MRSLNIKSSKRKTLEFYVHRQCKNSCKKIMSWRADYKHSRRSTFLFFVCPFLLSESYLAFAPSAFANYILSFQDDCDTEVTEKPLIRLWKCQCQYLNYSKSSWYGLYTGSKLVETISGLIATQPIYAPDVRYTAILPEYEASRGGARLKTPD